MGRKRTGPEGIIEGYNRKLREQVERKLAKGKSPEVIAEELDIDFDTVAQTNIDKLRSRQDRDTLSGSGDDR